MLVRTVRSGTRPPAREPARSVVHHPAVLRRIAAVVVLAGLGSLPCVLLAPAAMASPVAAVGAVRLVSPGGSRVSGRWQAWANRSRVPTVTGRVVLRATGCPGLPKVAGCVYTSQPRVIYIKPGLTGPREVLLHELGHVFDLTVLGDRDRDRFRKVMGLPQTPWWSGTRPLAEWFAEAYHWCARFARIRSVKREAIYRYDPTPSQHRRSCALIKSAARDRTPPEPPKAPPVVTGDPAPQPTAPAPAPAGAPAPTILPIPTIGFPTDIEVPSPTPAPPKPTATATPT